MSRLSQPILLLSLVLLAGCGDEATQASGPKPPPQPTVLVQKISFEAASTVKTYAATIQPRTSSAQAFRVPGKIMRRLVDIGDAVSIGTPLAELDATDLKLQLTQAEAELTAARFALDQQEEENIRQHRLAARHVSTPRDVERQQAITDEAQSRATRAQQAVNLARNAITYATLLSDTDGVVTATAVEAGQVAAAGQPAITVARNGDMEVAVSIPEDDVNALRNAPASLSIWSKPGTAYSLKLRELSPLADPATRTYAARYTIIGNNPDLHLGMSGEVTLNRNADKSASVPLAALVDLGKGPSVWSVDRTTGKIILKPVRVAKLEQTTALIASGLEDGEYIVALGAQKLDAGLTVKPVETLQR